MPHFCILRNRRSRIGCKLRGAFAGKALWAVSSGTPRPAQRKRTPAHEKASRKGCSESRKSGGTPLFRAFTGFASRIRSRAAKPAKYENLWVFIRSDAPVVRAGWNIRGCGPLSTPGFFDTLKASRSGCFLAAGKPCLLTGQGLCAEGRKGLPGGEKQREAADKWTLRFCPPAAGDGGSRKPDAFTGKRSPLRRRAGRPPRSRAAGAPYSPPGPAESAARSRTAYQGRRAVGKTRAAE